MSCCMHFLSCFSRRKYRCRTHPSDTMEGKEWGMVEKSGNQFVVNGQPFFASGFNTYWLMVFAADPLTRAKVSEVLHQASLAGFTVCRTWAFNDATWRALRTSPSTYDEGVFQGLDFVVSEAKKYGIRLVLSLANNWNEYGGKPQYVKWGREAGLNLTSDDDFFSDSTIKSYYKSHVKTILTRVNTFTNIAYKDDPTIFAWELMNEPRCPSDPSGDTLQAWIEEMAAHVKSIDPRHLLEIGVEGFYGSSTPERLQLNPNTCCGQEGTDFVRNHQAPGIDFASIHVYPDSWLSNSVSDVQLEFIKTWIQSHLADADNVLGMPVMIGEFGVSTKSNKFSSAFRNDFITMVYDIMRRSMGRGGSGGACLIWQIFPEGTEYMDDGYAVVLSKSNPTSHILSHHSKRFQALKPNRSSKCFWCWKKKDADSSNLSHEEL